MRKNKKLILLMVIMLGVGGCNNSIQSNINTSAISPRESDVILQESYFLPIGSVVKLNERDDLIMIDGLMGNYNGRTHAFIGVSYPEGYSGDSQQIYFNVKDIERVIYLGEVTKLHVGFEEERHKDYIVMNGEIFFTDEYKGFINYSQATLSKEESDRIKESGELYPIGTSFTYNEDVSIMVIGYYPLFRSVWEKEDFSKYLCVITPVGNLGIDGDDVRIVSLKELNGYDIAILGYKDESYYKLVRYLENGQKEFINITEE